MITASAGLTGMNQSQYSQIIPTASALFGFNDIYLPFTPQPGDFIRFEYNPSKVHIIHENILTDNGNMVLKIVPSIPMTPNIYKPSSVKVPVLSNTKTCILPLRLTLGGEIQNI
jgi:hypothetical protein